MRDFTSRRIGVMFVILGLASLSTLCITQPTQGQPIWTEDVRFIREPTLISGNGILRVEGIPPNAGPLQNTATGFNYTDQRIVYTSDVLDVGRQVWITWTMTRNFRTGNNGFFGWTSVTMEGSVDCPDLLDMTGIGASCSIGIPHSISVAFADGVDIWQADGIFAEYGESNRCFVPSNFFGDLGAQADIWIKPVAAGEVFEVSFPGSILYEFYYDLEYPIGACCYGSHECVVLTELECYELPDYYVWLVGEECDPNPCPPTAIEETSWGRIKMMHK